MPNRKRTGTGKQADGSPPSPSFLRMPSHG